MKNLKTATMTSATFEIRTFKPRESVRTWNPLDLKRAIEEITGLEITHYNRERRYTETRAIFFHLAQNYSHAHLVEIGRHVNRTHATVINGLKQYEALYQYDLKFRSYADEVIAKVFTKGGGK